MIDLQQVWNMPQQPKPPTPGGQTGTAIGTGGGANAGIVGAQPSLGRGGGANAGIVGTQPTQQNAWDYSGDWAYPSQWGAGGYNINWMEKADDIPANPMQQWYRDPSWGGHIGWQPEYGFQDWTDVGNQVYHTGGWEQDYATFQQNMNAAGFTPQMGNWQDYFPERVGDGTGGGGGTGSGWDWSNILIGGQPGDPGGEVPPGTGGYDMSGYTGETGAFPYPQEWDTASNALTGFTQGTPTATPDIWNQGASIASQMGQTGMPTDTSPAYLAAQQVVQQDTVDAIQQAAEQAGLTGLRWSTPMGRSAQDIAGRNMAQLGAAWTQQEMGAQEAARNRQLQGTSQMYDFGAGTAGLQESASNRALQASGMLPGLGQMYLNAPQDWAQQMYGMGSGMQQQGQSALNNYMNEFLRLAPENSPWLQQIMQYANPSMGMGGAQQYQPSTGGGIMDMVGAVGSGVAALCGGG